MTGFVLKADGYNYAPPIDPEEELDYKLDLTAVIGQDSVSGCTWEVDVANVTIVTAKNTFTTSSVTVWLKNGVLGTTTLVTAHITTTGGRKYDRSFKIECKAL